MARFVYELAALSLTCGEVLHLLVDPPLLSEESSGKWGSGEGGHGANK
jgi:hypothetical protein